MIDQSGKSCDCGILQLRYKRQFCILFYRDCGVHKKTKFKIQQKMGSFCRKSIISFNAQMNYFFLRSDFFFKNENKLSHDAVFDIRFLFVFCYHKIVPKPKIDLWLPPEPLKEIFRKKREDGHYDWSFLFWQSPLQPHSLTWLWLFEILSIVQIAKRRYSVQKKIPRWFHLSDSKVNLEKLNL